MQSQRNDVVQPIERWAFVLIGALQGFSVHWIEHWLDATDEGGLLYGFIGGLYAAVLVGPFIYAIARFHAPRLVGAKTALIVAGVYGVLYGLAFGRFGDMPFSAYAFLGPSLAILITGAINAHRLPPIDPLSTRFVLATWSSGIACMLAIIAGCLVYILVYFSSDLLKITGFQRLADLLMEEAFIFSLLGGVAGLFLALLAERERLMDGVVQVIILACRYLFVFLIALIALCLFALTFSEDIEIDRYLSVAGLCLGLGTGAIVAGLTGQIPSPPLASWLSQLHRYCWIAIVPLIGFAGAALLERIIAYCLTPERLFGLIAAALLGLVSFGFACSAFAKNRQRWRDNTIQAGLGATAVFAILSLTPYVSWVDLSVGSQADRILDDSGTVNEGAARFLWYNAGLVGKAKMAAFEAGLTDDTALASLAEIKEGRRSWQLFNDMDAKTFVSEMIADMSVLPSGTPLPDGFSSLDWNALDSWAQSEIGQSCGSSMIAQPCTLYVGDVFISLPGNEVILKLPAGDYADPTQTPRLVVFAKGLDSNQWEASYMFQASATTEFEEDFAIVPSNVNDIIINGVRYGY